MYLNNSCCELVHVNGAIFTDWRLPFTAAKLLCPISLSIWHKAWMFCVSPVLFFKNCNVELIFLYLKNNKIFKSGVTYIAFYHLLNSRNFLSKQAWQINNILPKENPEMEFYFMDKITWRNLYLNSIKNLKIILKDQVSFVSKQLPWIKCENKY